MTGVFVAWPSANRGNGKGTGMNDVEVIAAIRARHKRANISDYAEHEQHWHRAWVDPGGTIFGPGPYVKLPVGNDREGCVIRVYAPERLRIRLAMRWCNDAERVRRILWRDCL